MSSDFTAIEMKEPRPHRLSNSSPEAVSQYTKRSGIVRLTIDIPESYKSTSPNAKSHPRWWTREFIAYYVLACIVIPYMIWIPISLSSVKTPYAQLIYPKLSPGWLFGRQVDNSDSQYRGFRDHFPLLCVLALVYVGTRSLYVRLAPQPSPTSKHLFQVPFILAFSILMIFGLTGASAIKILVILSLNYLVTKIFGGRRMFPILTWAFNMAILFANDRNSGYLFSSLHPSLGYLDDIRGIYPRWHVNYNVTMLRLISFGLDYHWTLLGSGSQDPGSALSYKERTKTLHDLEYFSFQNYLSYALFPPLYIAGPIITFNDFMWQLRRPLQISAKTIFSYAIRFAICLLTMEFILHFMYVVAIKDTRAWSGDTPFELSMVGFWNLIIVWLKLLIPWRFFRLFSLLASIDPPENMVRCMANNYSPLGFWRAWHRSYNLWVVRYLYVPLGGAKNVVAATFATFTFVALWHDLEAKLLAWGWLISLFVLPELGAKYLISGDKYGQQWWYRHIAAIGAAFNILAMMAANLVGFVIGTDGVSHLLNQIFGSFEGWQFLAITIACLYIAAQLMFEYREEEMRRGVYLRC